MKANAFAIGEKQTRFKRLQFTNHSGSKSWRVSGTRRNSERVRENYPDENSARCRQIELEAEWLARDTETAIRSTRLTEDQLGIAEACFKLVDVDTHLLTAVNFWLAHGKQEVPADAPLLDDAFEQFKAWIIPETTIRPLTKSALKIRVSAFVNRTRNVPVSAVTREMVEKFLLDMNGSPRTRINYRGGMSRFFSWCMESPRKWIVANPCAAVKIKTGDTPPPQVLNVADCQKLMLAAEKFKEGALVPYLTLALFGGLRPFEARRLRGDQVNFDDNEIRLEGSQTKTRRGRTFVMDKTTAEWLKAYKGRPFFPANFRNDISALLRSLGYSTDKMKDGNLKRWHKDILRHTSISHFFRHSHSYGQTAERFGNSEAIIKRHYQGRVSSDDTKQFYAIKPQNKRRRV